MWIILLCLYRFPKPFRQRGKKNFFFHPQNCVKSNKVEMYTLVHTHTYKHTETVWEVVSSRFFFEYFYFFSFVVSLFKSICRWLFILLKNFSSATVHKIVPVPKQIWCACFSFNILNLYWFCFVSSFRFGYDFSFFISFAHSFSASS